MTLESLPDLVEAVRPAVVYIETARGEAVGNGSGFAIAPDESDNAVSIVVTNAHVAEAEADLHVRFHDASEHKAEIRLRDESTDLALLTIPEPAPLTLPL